MEFDQRFEEYREQVEGWLKTCFRGAQPRADLYDAMNYSLLAGGKRIRPILTLECCRMCGGEPEKALPLACAVEMVHTYSLIHDDLPCMDDDDLRRGRATNHKVYGEATALLAGDGLLTAAFEAIAGAELPPERIVEAVRCLSAAAGAAGMVGGQALDLAGEGHSLAEPEVVEIHRLKTGAMMIAAAELGCIAADAGSVQRKAAATYAARVGLAFQIRDDMLDVESTAEDFGKSVGSDAAHEKDTFVTLKGLDNCRDEVERLTRQAAEALEPLRDRAWFLKQLAWRLAERTK